MTILAQMAQYAHLNHPSIHTAWYATRCECGAVGTDEVVFQMRAGREFILLDLDRHKWFRVCSGSRGSEALKEQLDKLNASAVYDEAETRVFWNMAEFTLEHHAAQRNAARS
jgi:hypothetical protein